MSLWFGCRDCLVVRSLALGSKILQDWRGVLFLLFIIIIFPVNNNTYESSTVRVTALSKPGISSHKETLSILLWRAKLWACSELVREGLWKPQLALTTDASMWQVKVCMNLPSHGNTFLPYYLLCRGPREPDQLRETKDWIHRVQQEVLGGWVCGEKTMVMFCPLSLRVSKNLRAWDTRQVHLDCPNSSSPDTHL